MFASIVSISFLLLFPLNFVGHSLLTSLKTHTHTISSWVFLSRVPSPLVPPPPPPLPEFFLFRRGCPSQSHRSVPHCLSDAFNVIGVAIIAILTDHQPRPSTDLTFHNPPVTCVTPCPIAVDAVHHTFVLTKFAIFGFFFCLLVSSK